MSPLDAVAAVGFISFFAIETVFGNNDNPGVLWQLRLTWLGVCIGAIVVIERIEHSSALKQHVSTADSTLHKLETSKVETNVEVLEIVPAEPTEEEVSPTIETTVAEISQILTSPNSVLDASAVKKRKSFLRRTASALVSPLSRSSRSTRSKKSDTSTIREVSMVSDGPTSASALSVGVEASVNASFTGLQNNSELSTPKLNETTLSSSRQSPISPSSNISVDQFGYGPPAPAPPPDFCYVNPNTWGYLGHLDEKQTAALDEMRSRNYSCIESRGPNPKFVINDETLLRFLRARKFDIDKASKMLEAHLAWRDKYLPSTLTPNDIASVLGQGVARFGPYSKSGLIATMIKVEWFDPAKFEGDVDLFIKYVAFFFERGITKLPRGGDKGMLFFDMKGWSIWKHASRFALKLTAELINIIQAHNPERLEKCILFNTPLLFSGTWSIIKGLLDPVVTAKIMFVSDTKVMLDLFEKEHLPIEYGGERTLPYPIEGFAELHTAVDQTPVKG